MRRRAPIGSAFGLAAWLVAALAVHGGVYVAIDQGLWPSPPWLREYVELAKELTKPLDEVEVEWKAIPDSGLVALPDLDKPLDEVTPGSDDTAPEVAKAPAPVAAELVPPPPPPPVILPPPPVVAPPPPELAAVPPPPPPPPQAPTPKMKAVEVDDDENVIDEINEDATYLSDKNRRVKEETRATDTNLDRAQKGKAAASEENDDQTSEEVGGAEEKIAQLEDVEASSLDAKRHPEESFVGGRDDEAKGVRTGDQGGGGARGDGGDNGAGGGGGKPGALSMRDIEGKGAPGREGAALDPTNVGADGDAPMASSSKPGGEIGDGGRAGPEGKRGRKGLKLQIDPMDYERIVGKDKLHEETELARRNRSMKRGRWERKMAAIKSSLENFTPEVKPGNQTALGTRAAPFALYLAKMHRNIHELWGFGFLADLDGKSATYELNDRDLKVLMEIVLTPDGEVDKVTIVRGSGKLTFDVAAVDTIHAAGPYGAPPDAIRSKDGKVYLHWTFHRNEFQCSTQFADPFILDNPPKGSDSTAKRGLPEPSDAIARRAKPQRLSRAEGSAEEGGVQVPHVHREGESHGAGSAHSEGEPGAAGARAAASMPTPDDPAAQQAGRDVLQAFARGDAAGLIMLSGVPFRSGGTIVAADARGLPAVWRNVLAEAPNRKGARGKLVSAAGYRLAFGNLPASGEDGTPTLFLVIQLGRDRYTLQLAPQANGVFKVVALDL